MYPTSLLQLATVDTVLYLGTLSGQQCKQVDQILVLEKPRSGTFLIGTDEAQELCFLRASHACSALVVVEVFFFFFSQEQGAGQRQRGAAQRSTQLQSRMHRSRKLMRQTTNRTDHSFLM